LQQGGQPQKFADPGPQFRRQFVIRADRRRIVQVNDFRPRNGQFGARAVGQLDQVARLRVCRVPGSPQHINNLIVQWVVGMNDADDSAIL